MSEDPKFPFRKGDTFGEGPHPDDAEGQLVQAAIHATNAMIVIADMTREDAPLVFVNDRFCEFTGYGRDEVLGRNCRFLQHRPDAPRDGEQEGLTEVRDALREGRSARVVIRNYKKDGTRFWNELFLSPIRAGILSPGDTPPEDRDDATGDTGSDGGSTGGRVDGDEREAVTHFVGVQNDVTERVEKDRDLRLLYEGVDVMGEAVLITDADLEDPGPRIRYVNPAFTAMTGYTAEEAVGRSPRMLQGPRTSQEELDRLRRTLAEGGTFRGEAINYRRDRTEYLVEWTVSPVRLDGGAITHWVSSQRDMTRQRMLERAVLEAQDAEQARVARDLHDGIAQQLAAVSMLAQLMSRRVTDTGLPEPLVDLRRDLDDLTAAAAEAIEDVRRVSHGLMPVPDKPDGLARALDQLAATTARVQGVGCEFRRTGAGTPPHPETANHLYRIAQEAVGNAVRHGRCDRIEVRLAHDDTRLTLTVSDDGCGVDGHAADGAIPPESLAGAGIGLRTMGFRASLIGGRLRLRPRDGGGTVVECTAPAGGPVVAGE